MRISGWRKIAAAATVGSFSRRLLRFRRRVQPTNQTENQVEDHAFISGACRRNERQRQSQNQVVIVRRRVKTPVSLVATLARANVPGRAKEWNLFLHRKRPLRC